MHEQNEGSSQEELPVAPLQERLAILRRSLISGDRAAELHEAIRRCEEARSSGQAGDDCIAPGGALIEEAQRELGKLRVREQRACYEALHAALEQFEAEPLALAIENCRNVGIVEEDLVEPQDRLCQRRSESPEAREARLRAQELHRIKKELLLFVRRDDVNSLRTALEAGNIPEDTFLSFRDHSGRSLLQYAEAVSSRQSAVWLRDLKRRDLAAQYLERGSERADVSLVFQDVQLGAAADEKVQDVEDAVWDIDWTGIGSSNSSANDDYMHTEQALETARQKNGGP